jgi:hypothetical protein
MKYKVGDRVKLNKDCGKYSKGTTGMIVEVIDKQELGYFYRADFDTSIQYHESYFELLPNSIVIDTVKGKLFVNDIDLFEELATINFDVYYERNKYRYKGIDCETMYREYVKVINLQEWNQNQTDLIKKLYKEIESLTKEIEEADKKIANIYRVLEEN